LILRYSRSISDLLKLDLEVDLQGADPHPSFLYVRQGKAGRYQLKEEITPLLTLR
jgi:hypothetical protein